MAETVKLDSSHNVPDISTRHGFYGLAATFLLFHILNRIVKYSGPPKSIAVRGKDEVWKWRNLFLSWIHALIVGSWDLSCFYFYPTLMYDLVGHVVPYTYFMVVFSTGYFLYDFGDMLVHNKVFKMWELTLHHIAVTSMFLYNVVSGRCIAYNVVALLAEVNSFFLHTRKLLQMHRFSFSHWSYRINAVLNIVTFAVCRGYALGRITYGMTTDRAKVPTLYFYVLCGSMFIMNSLNPILFWILLKNDFLRKDYGEKHSSNEGNKKKMEGDHDKATPELINNGNGNKPSNHVDNFDNGQSMNGHVTAAVKIKHRLKNADVAANIDANKIE